MIKYRLLIEENFLIDRANSGELVPFIFNEVQNAYYDDLVRDYDIENNGINIAIRENILKARREGFSSLILAIFAADDVLQDNPTETDVLSYKDDATGVFLKRYRTFVLSYFAKENGFTTEQIQQNINILEEIAAAVLSVDSDEIEIRWNKAHFQSNTASARVGGRGGVRHKILFSEIAFYPDTQKMLASEMVEATMRQVDVSGGWIFAESTENGMGTYQHRMWVDAKLGLSRFKNRFYGAGKFYSAEQMAVIRSEYVDMDSFRRDYPMTEDDLFKGSAKAFTTEVAIDRLINPEGVDKKLAFWLEMHGENYIDQAEIIKAQIEALERSSLGHAWYWGLDTAKSIDGTILSGIKDGRTDLKGGTKCIAIDVTNGDFMADWFAKNTKWYVEKIKFSRPSKSLMYTQLQVVIADKLTALPVMKVDGEWVSDEAKHFYDQLIHLEKEQIGDLLVVHHPKGSCNQADHNYDTCVYHDDYPDSWMLAEHAYIAINGVPKRVKKPEALTVPNAVSNMLNRSSRRSRYTGGDSFE